MKRGQILEVRRSCSASPYGFEVDTAIAITGKVVMRDLDGLGSEFNEPCFWARIEFEHDHWERVGDIVIRNAVS